jgi:hypothetical protein
MLGRRDPQWKLFSAAQQLGDEAIKKLGFYGKVASEGYKMSLATRSFSATSKLRASREARRSARQATRRRSSRHGYRASFSTAVKSERALHARSETSVRALDAGLFRWR